MRTQKCDFKEAVNFYLTKHSAAKKVIQDWLKTKDQNSEMFEAAIHALEKAKDARNAQYEQEKQHRRGLSGKLAQSLKQKAQENLQENRRSSKIGGGLQNSARLPKAGTSPKSSPRAS